mmetsp:Transcript_6451/g.14066  ORF Transcript_6451/g.14066 Transcript_6451/m.14066 type:complete len:218 (+) Transcript_6451:594-1247(+)
MANRGAGVKGQVNATVGGKPMRKLAGEGTVNSTLSIVSMLAVARRSGWKAASAQVRARVWDGLTIGIDRRKVVQVPCLLDLYWPCRAQQEAMPRNSSWVAAVHRVDAKGNDRLGRLWVSDSKQVIRLVIWEQRQQEAARNVSKQHLERERPELSVRVRAREKGTDRARVDRHLLTRGARASQLGLCLTSLRLRSRRREGLKGIRLTPDEVAGRCRRE